MRMLFLVLALLAAPLIAHAQSVDPSTGVPMVNTLPATTHGYGYLTVTSASAAITTLTPSPNSGSLSFAAGLPAGTITIQSRSTSAGSAYVCPLGGTCTSTVGVELVPGGAPIGINVGPNTLVAPTIIAPSGAVVSILW